MGKTTGIAWTNHTHNEWIGCDKVSPGCTNCYAEVHRAVRILKVEWGKGKPRHLTSIANRRKPLAWNRAAAMAGEQRKVFCSSLSDWLDPEVPASWLADLLVSIELTPCLDWQLLTKRPELWRDRLKEAQGLMLDGFEYVLAAKMVDDWLDGTPPANVWIGTTVEDQKRANERIPALLAIPARVRFLSMEPLLEAIDLGSWLGDYDCHACNCRFWSDGLSSLGVTSVGFRCDEDCRVGDGSCNCGVEICPHCQTDNGDGNSNATVGPRSESDEEYHPTGIQWVIVGGESGPNARPFDLHWARSIVRQCKYAGVSVFVKQMGDRVVADERNVRGLRLLQLDPKNYGLRDDLVRVRFSARAGADPVEWPEDLRVQQFPAG